MNVLLARVRMFAARHRMWRPETRVIAAVSGGSDSVALLCLLHDLHAAGDLVLDAVAHLHHGIRGADADRDEAFCRALADRLAVAFVAERIDAPALARRDGVSIEVAARRARSAFLDRVRAARRADRIATAHTADDQAETVLLRLVRGTGLRGLGGIAPVRGDRIRPLLECDRVELQAALAARGQSWCEDATNADLTHPRNRVRHEVLPRLARHFNPAIRRALGRLADLARADDEALQDLAARAAAEVVRRSTADARIDRERLRALPEAVARRVVRDTLAALGVPEPGLADVEAVRAVAAGEAAAADRPALRVELSGADVVLVPSGAAPPPPAPFRLELRVPGSVSVPGAGWILDAEGPFPRAAASPQAGTPWRVAVDARGLGDVLIVRSREPGDRIRPLGLAGRKKVQDVLVDRKVARAARDRVPIVSAPDGRLVWVAGHALGADFRVTDGTNAVVILKLRRL